MPSVISASVAERRFNCPGSVEEIHLPREPPSVYAAEGTRLHKLMEEALDGKLPANVEGDEKFWDVHASIINYMKEKKITSYDLELYYTHKCGPDVKGTLDFVGASSDTTYVVDYKFGDGTRVSPVRNLQLGFYYQGLVDNADPLLRDNVVFVIAQPWPGENTIQEWTAPPEWRAAYSVLEKNAYRRIKNGDDARNAGPWCTYCRLAPTCPETNKALLHANLPDDPRGLSGAELSHLLDVGERAVEQYKRLVEYAHKFAEQGGNIPGRKLIEASGNRKWLSEKAVVERFGDLAYEAPKVRSPAQLEKAGKKAGVDVTLDDLVTRARTKKLVDAGHPAPAITPGEDLKDEAKRLGLV